MSTDDLLRRALEESTSDTVDDESYWAAVRALRDAPLEQIWKRVTPLAFDPDPQRRALVPDVLRYLGGSEQPRLDETVALLGRMLETERDALVLQAIASAFVDLNSRAAIDLLRPLLSHADATVRRAAVCGLLPVATRVVPELIRLSADDDDDVRNWATFGLGNQLGRRGDADFVDTAYVRDALVARLNDPHDETRAEAVLGLAIRGDERAVPVIAAEIARGAEWTHYIEAAELLGDPRLHAVLVEAARNGKVPVDATKAIAACDPTTHASRGAK